MLFIALPLLAYVGEGIYRYQQMLAESELRINRALRVAREHALKILQTNEILLERIETVIHENLEGADGVDENVILRNKEQALHEQFGAMSLDKAQTDSIWVYGVDGRPLVTDRFYPAPVARLNVSDRSYFTWHLDHRDSLYLSERITGRLTGTLFISMSRGRHRPDGSFSGVISLNLSTAYLEAFHKEIVADEPGMAIAMVREDGAILTRWPAIANQPSQLPAGSFLLRDIGADRQSGSVRTISSIDQHDRLITYSKIGKFPVYIVASMAVDQIRQNWLIGMGWLAALGFPATIALYLAGRLALRRTQEALSTAELLKAETISRKQVEDTLLQAQKMEALGRLTGGVAHDFNNALMVISTNLYLLKRKHPDANDKEVAAIDRSVETATKLTRQLLAFSRRQPLVPECLDMQDWLVHVQDLLVPVLGRQVQLSISTKAGTSAIWVDSAELELALINLAINARDAMPSGGQLSIIARNAGADLPPGLTGDMVMIEVSDTGTGIAPDILDKVFEPFFTTKPVGEGTGLGLSQIYGLCQRANGKATVQSQPGVGTTFRLYFPAYDKQAQSAEKPPKTAPQNLAMDVLLVEDNDDVAEALIPVLEAMGCKVRHFDRATTARDWLACQSILPDLLLSDVVMPGAIDGLDLAKLVRQKYPALPIVLMSGYAEQFDAITRLGFEIVPKPCTPDRLAETIKRATTETGLAGNQSAA